MNLKFRTLSFFIGLLIALPLSASQAIEEYTLGNGFTVILNPDESASDVFGVVAVKAGSYNEPEDATGLAHYLEHVLFKGTQEIGTIDWEAEKASYEKIIQLFEDMRATEDSDEKKRISKEINELSIEAGKYTISNEFSNLVQGIGGTSLNAGTGYDNTVYYNAFPSFQLERWLEIYSARFVNPVFRGFQAELENVYEEKNMYGDSPFSVLSETFQENAYGKDHPYGRSIIGTTEHLKNPSLKKLIEFYETNYVPGNMALVLSGKFDVNLAKNVIERTFGSWESKSVPTVKTYAPKTFKGEEVVKIKSSPLPVGFWAFKGVAEGNADEIPLEIMTAILSNGNETGLLDKLALDGDIQAISAGIDARKYDGNIVFQAIPTFDLELMKYNSIASAEKLMMNELDKLRKGEFEDWLLEAVKADLITDFKLAQESPEDMAMLLAQLFLYNTNKEYIDTYVDKVNAVTKDKVVSLANQYLGKDYLHLLSLTGTTPKDIIKKPELEPIVPSTGHISAFAEQLQEVPMGELDEDFVDFTKDFQQGTLSEGVDLFYTPNPENDIFSMRIIFGAGSHEIPAIGLATSLMNSAGIMAQLKAHEVKKEFSKLGCSYYFGNNDSYTYIQLAGKEDNLEEVCKLLSKLYLLPELDEKQMDRLLGMEVGSRSIEQHQKEVQFNALVNYIRYGENSPQIDRITTSEIKDLTLSSLAAKFIEATHYETSVHYVGKTPFDELKQKLTSSLAFPSGLKPSASPYIRPLNEPEERTVYFISNKEATQSNIILFAKGDDYTLQQEPYADAFNQYFSGGFNGLVMQELRELRSFAYSAGASYVTPQKEQVPAYFMGQIGTQADKTTDAVNEFLKLIDDMPEKPERMDNIRKYLTQASISSKPHFRYLTSTVENWERLGYNDDPRKRYVQRYEEMSFEDIKKYYNDHIKGKSLSIAIIGNKKEIDMDALNAIAKVQTIPSGKLFKD